MPTVRSTRSQDGFSIVEVLVVIVVVVVLCGVGWVVHNVYDNTRPSDTLATTLPFSSSQSSTSSTYAGWNSFTFSMTKISQKYPSGWMEMIDTDDPEDLNGPGPIKDNYMYMTSDNFMVDANINTPDVTITNGPATIRFTRQVMFEGKKGYLDFYSTGSDTTIDNVNLSESPYNPFDYFTGTYNGKPYFFEMSGTPAAPQTVAAAQADARYNDMAKVVESTRGAQLTDY